MYVCVFDCTHFPTHHINPTLHSIGVCRRAAAVRGPPPVPAVLWHSTLLLLLLLLLRLCLQCLHSGASTATSTFFFLFLCVAPPCDLSQQLNDKTGLKFSTVRFHEYKINTAAQRTVSMCAHCIFRQVGNTGFALCAPRSRWSLLAHTPLACLQRVCERERERERLCVCVCVCRCLRLAKQEMQTSTNTHRCRHKQTLTIRDAEACVAALDLHAV